MNSIWFKKMRFAMLAAVALGVGAASAATVKSSATSAEFRFDTREGARESTGTETLTYSGLWSGDSNSVVTISQACATPHVVNGAVAEGLVLEGEQVWNAEYDGEYTLTHATITGGVTGAVETATFVVKGLGYPPVQAEVTGFVCDYKIINTRKENFDNACAGLYFDWDIVNSLTNCADYDPEHKMVYIFNTGNIGLYGGICLLDNRNAVPYVFEAGSQNSINLEDGFSNEQKWEAMNHARSYSTGSGIDLALMLSSNNLELKSNDTICLKFAVLAGENLYELKKAADKAMELYGVKKQDVSIADAATSELKIYPTVTESALYVESASGIAHIGIYSTSGLLELQTEGSGNSATIDTSLLKSGVHIVCVTDGCGRKLHKMVVKR